MRVIPALVSSALLLGCVTATPAAATQDTIFAAVGGWIAEHHADDLTAGMYVLEDMAERGRRHSAEDVPELRGDSVLVGREALTSESRSPIEDAFRSVTPLEFVPDADSVVDANAIDVWGCRPYFDGRPMLKLRAPILVNDRYFVELNLDQGCHGYFYLLAVDQQYGQSEVTSLRSGQWYV